MKKAIALFFAALLTLSLSACTKHCKVEDCDREVYKDGYCQLHYTAHSVENAVNGFLGK